MGINGITVELEVRTQTGTDEFDRPVYETAYIEIPDVLVAPTSGDDILSQQNLYGRKAIYTLGIPKGDEHVWENCKVRFFGEEFRVFGKPLEGIESNIPLRWNKKVTVEKYE